jgi:hypothetical protein
VALAGIALLSVTYPIWPLFAEAYRFVITTRTERGLLASKDEAIGLIEITSKSFPRSDVDLDLSHTKLGALATLDELDQFLWRDARFENIDYVFVQENREEALTPLSQETSSGTVPASIWVARRSKGICTRQYRIRAWHDQSKKALQVFGDVSDYCDQTLIGPVPEPASAFKDARDTVE